jgi:hypothetical protein
MCSFLKLVLEAAHVHFHFLFHILKSLSFACVLADCQHLLVSLVSDWPKKIIQEIPFPVHNVHLLKTGFRGSTCVFPFPTLHSQKLIICSCAGRLSTSTGEPFSRLAKQNVQILPFSI